MKSFLKEIIIILLLCLIICVILGITFYKYIPNTKIVPSEVEKYKTSETIKDEIEQTTVDYSNTTVQNVTFEITDSDLRLYKNSGSYSTGKSNPFVVESGDSTNTDTNTENGNNQGSGETIKNTTTNSGSNNNSGKSELK